MGGLEEAEAGALPAGPSAGAGEDCEDAAADEEGEVPSSTSVLNSGLIRSVKELKQAWNYSRSSCKHGIGLIRLLSSLL
jgi:hypothetical protein